MINLVQTVNLSQSVLNARQCFGYLIETAEELEHRGKIVGASTCASMAAQVAWRNHAGFFFSASLEDLLLRLGTRVGGLLPSLRKIDNDGVVFHVLSGATGISGDTRFVWRWIKLDSSNRHSVVLTHQMGKPIPDSLQNAVAQSGGLIHVLDEPDLNLIRIAESLRNVVAGAKVVFLHTYPDDIVPMLAFAIENNSPPIVIVNQSDHTFWVGASIADLVLELRDAGRLLSQTARGILPSRTEFLPIPLMDFSNRRNIVNAKARLGLSNKKVLLSIAVGFKYTPLLEPTWQDLIIDILDRDSDVVCVVIGPKSTDPVWQKTIKRCAGHLLVPGPTPETALYYDAADVYLDSFPFSSNTSLLEAGVHGVPLITFCPHKDYANILCAGAVGLDGVMAAEVDSKSYVERVLGLLRSEELKFGDKTRERLITLHGPDGWRKALDKIYEQISQIAQKPRKVMNENLEVAIDNRLHNLLQQLYFISGHYVSIAGMAEKFVSQLAYFDRLFLVRRLRELDNGCSRDLLLPNWIRQALKIIQ